MKDFSKGTVGRGSIKSSLSSGPYLRSGATYLKFWAEQEGRLVQTGSNVQTVPLWQIANRVAVEKIAKGLTEEPYYLIEYSNVYKSSGILKGCEVVNSIGSDKILLKPNTLAYGRLEPNLGKMFIVPSDQTYISTTEFVSLRIDDARARPDYVRLILQLPEARVSLGLLKAGKCQQRADYDKLLRCLIPLVQVDQQDELLAEVRPIEQEMEGLVSRKPEFQKIVDEGFEGAFASPDEQKASVYKISPSTIAERSSLRMGFRYLSMATRLRNMLSTAGRTISLQSVIEVRGGKRVPKGTSYANTATGYGFLRGNNIGRGAIKADDILSIDPLTFEKIKQSCPEDGEVLLTVAGVVGRAACANGMSKIAITDNVSMLRPKDSNQINTQFLMYLMLSSFMQFQFSREMSELRQQKLSLETIRALKIPAIPDISVQAAIVEAIHDKFREADNIEKQIAALQRKVNAIVRKYIAAEMRDDDLILEESEFASDDDADSEDYTNGGLR